MSHIATASVWNMTEISSSQKMVLLVLANRVNQDTGNCFPSLNTIAAEACLSQRNVQRVIRSLEDAQLITVEREKDRKGRNRPNQYRLNFEYTTRVETPRPHVETPCPQGKDTMSPHGRDTMSPEPTLNQKPNQGEDSSRGRRSRSTPVARKKISKCVPHSSNHELLTAFGRIAGVPENDQPSYYAYREAIIDHLFSNQHTESFKELILT